jgi:hypothetical protein
MKRLEILLSAVVILYFFGSDTAVSQSKYTGQSIEQILAMPDDSINLGIACLVLAKDAYPNLNIDFFDYCINYMVDRIDSLGQGKTDPLLRIGLMNTYLYRPGWWNDSITFTYNLDDLEGDSTSDQFLNGYIATKLGSCVTMSMLHLALAQRLGWPIRPVRSAKHFYCRYIKKGFKLNNIEATCGGGYIPTWRYTSDAGEPKKAIKNGVYERILTNKEYIAGLLEENARFFLDKKKNLDKAIYYTRLSLVYDSTNSGAWWNLGELYRRKAIELDSIRYERIQDVKREYAILDEYPTHFPTPQPQVQVDPNLQPIQIIHPDQFIQQVPPDPTQPRQPVTTMFDQYTRNMAPQPPSILQKPNNPYNQFPVNQNPNVQRQNDEAEMMGEIAYINDSYGRQILGLIDLGHKLKAKAKGLGTVLKFPEKFFIKQAESIEKFKRTGQY